MLAVATGGGKVANVCVNDSVEDVVCVSAVLFTGASVITSADVSTVVGIIPTTEVLVGVGVFVGNSTANGVTVGVGNRLCTGSGVGVTVGKRWLDDGNSPPAPVFRIVAAAVGVMVATDVPVISVVSEMAAPVEVIVGVIAGVSVTVMAMTVVMVSGCDGSAVTGPNRASGETIGGDGTINWYEPAAERVKPFVSRKSVRLSSARLLVMIRENMPMSVAQWLDWNQAG